MTLIKCAGYESGDMTFIEAYEFFGRDSMAISEATGMSEAEAYNNMARRSAFDHDPVDAARAIKQEYRLRQRDRLRAIRQQHRVA